MMKVMLYLVLMVTIKYRMRINVVNLVTFGMEKSVKINYTLMRLILLNV